MCLRFAIFWLTWDHGEHEWVTWSRLAHVNIQPRDVNPSTVTQVIGLA
jgi:hypothetical protein